MLYCYGIYIGFMPLLFPKALRWVRKWNLMKKYGKLESKQSRFAKAFQVSGLLTPGHSIGL
jgi:hypothetical protein